MISFNSSGSIISFNPLTMLNPEPLLNLITPPLYDTAIAEPNVKIISAIFWAANVKSPFPNGLYPTGRPFLSQPVGIFNVA